MEMHIKDVRWKPEAFIRTAEHWTLSLMTQGGEISPRSQALLCSTRVMKDRVVACKE